MSNTVSPSWTDNITNIVSDQVLARGSVVSGTFNLATKVAGVVFVAIGRGGTTAITTSGCCVEIRRQVNGTTVHHPAPQASSRQGGLPAASNCTVNVNSNAGQNVININTTSGFAAKDLVCIQDANAGVLRLEWARVSKVGTNNLALDTNLQYSHTSAQADTVRNQSDVFAPIWLQGGATYEVIFDYGAAGAGESVTVRAMGQSYDSDTIV